ncbi:MAG TPA: DUF1549 and DUF1553 domain-containing protein [Verrucomicrobiae bacterium]|nr:DUF1549 and DUF1553 domain-containing protein [Verrucomicrobiae bacterium]
MLSNRHISPPLLARRIGTQHSRSRSLRRRSLAAVLGSLFLTTNLSAVGVSFRNDVAAVLSKAGCNAGACHGNANGKGGLKLSLRGEDPEFDFKALTRDMFGRRVNPENPDHSLLLLKPTTQIAHEGGQRFRQDSDEYRILHDWIADGSRPDPPATPRLERLEVTPAETILLEPATELQLQATAFFSDGSVRDVTKVAVYEAANELAQVSHDGLARRERDGETTILVRYLHTQKPVRLAFVPARPGFLWQDPKPNNYVDEHIFAKLRTLRINPSGPCSDGEFVRRASLDLLGILPTAAEARAFVADGRRDKRARLIDRLLERPEFADFWALKWADLLRAEERLLDRKGIETFYRWIRQGLATNRPLDRFVHELITARGSTYQNPAANFYRAIRDPVARAEAVSQVFLGTRLNCAQCHNHPFDRWTQDDYYDWSGLFARVNYKVLENRRRDDNDSHEFKGEQIVFVANKGDVKNPRTGRPANARFLGKPSVTDRESHIANRDNVPDELEALADWITSPQNPFFPRSQVNRVWFHLMGRGIVDPIDDFRPTNPASHPALLDALADDFVRQGFDLRHLIRLIMNSRTYQLSALPNDTNRDDDLNFSRAYVRRLTAEQLLDCQSQVTGVPAKFNGYPPGLRAAQLPGALAERKRDQKKTEVDFFLEVFGKPPRLLTCECERSGETTMSQAFQMISGPAINELLKEPENRLERLVASGKSTREVIDELYWSALTRAPTKAELTRASSLLEGASDRRPALEDLTWALLNAKEFLLRK